MESSCITSRTTPEEINRCLPQTQCTMCGYPRCLEYARAIAEGKSDINRCPPGGAETLGALAKLTNKAIPPPAEDCEPYTGRKIARIEEDICIGCTLCIPPCPLDAIIGTAKHLHSVIEENCSGCELCVDHCPVDCIRMIDVDVDGSFHFWEEFGDDEVARWRNLAQRHFERVSRGDQVTVDSELFANLKSQIREAVNRERSRRWKQANKKAARLQSARKVK